MKPIQWMWIDINCFNSENTLFFNGLKLLDIKIRRFNDYQSFAETFNDLTNPAHPTSCIPEIRVICSSSLSDEIYEGLQKLQKLQSVVIYCYQFEKGVQTLKKYSKIERVFTKDNLLMDFLNQVRHPIQKAK